MNLIAGQVLINRIWVYGRERARPHDRESVVALTRRRSTSSSGEGGASVTGRTAKAIHKEVQTHGYEVDLVTAISVVLIAAASCSR
jgi:hypothetical protein